MITASVTGSPRYSSAVCFILLSTIAEISAGAYSLPSTSILASPSLPSTILNGAVSRIFFTSGSLYLRPMSRLMAYRVRVGLVIACLLAICPTSRSPLSVNATTDGVVRLPSVFSITFGSPPSIMATQEFVVPRSMPMILPISFLLLLKFTAAAASLRRGCRHIVFLLSNR